jgi:hypothetical protein
MVTSLLVALILTLGTVGAAIITRLGSVKKLVNGRLAVLIQMIDDRDAMIVERDKTIAEYERRYGPMDEEGLRP